jgi:hypothetical protein
MSTRTTEQTVTFARPFTLSSLDGMQPAGTYRLVIDEEELPGLSFQAFQRLRTMLYLPANGLPGHLREVVIVDPAELAEAIEVDIATSAA